MAPVTQAFLINAYFQTSDGSPALRVLVIACVGQPVAAGPASLPNAE